MSGENLKILLDANSGESDFEIVNNSDSETEVNGYYKLQSDIKGRSNENDLKQSASNSVLNNKPKFGALRQDRNEKLKLSLSQEQITLLRKQKCPENGAVKKSRSSIFSKPSFTIVPIDISQKREQNSTHEKPNLPEIVLTSFEKNNNSPNQGGRMKDTVKGSLERKSTTDAFSLERKSTTDDPDKFQIRFDNTPQVFTYLYAEDGGGMQENGSLADKCSYEITVDNNEDDDSLATMGRKPLNSEGLFPYQLPIDRKPTSASPRISGDNYKTDEIREQISKDLKCRMCDQPYNDPRTLNCLHSFCFQCLVNENYGKDASLPFWSRPEEDQFEWESSTHSNSITNSNSDDSAIYSGSQQPNRSESRSSSSSSKSKKTYDRLSKEKSKASSNDDQVVEKLKTLVCCICHEDTEMPIGGIRQLPHNFLLRQKVEDFLLREGNDVISNTWCSLCCDDVIASYHCFFCNLNLCSFCKEAHERQKSTMDHDIRNLIEIRKLPNARKQAESRQNIKCSLHPGFDLKIFCLTCRQIVCADCISLLHKGHKNESANKAFKTCLKQLKDSTEKTKPLCEYTNHTISKLSTLSRKINQKCDLVQKEVEMFMVSYFQAIEVHHQTLLQQIARARDIKMQMILEQQHELEQRALKAKTAFEFSEELMSKGSDIEILSFVNILQRRLDFCQTYKTSLDPKVPDTLHFLPEIRAPSTKAQNNIPLYGIITTQTVEPNFCTLETEGFTQLRVHRKAEVLVTTRDTDGVPLCHGGLTINVLIKYKDSHGRVLNHEISDKRDGTYTISFTPDAAGVLILFVTINNKQIRGNPFILAARSVRPHSGIFHCCTFCSSKGSKTTTCACEGVMPGFKGCGHGHGKHPGRRHWSCCGNILENSECTTANSF